MTPWWSRLVKRFSRQAGNGDARTISPKDPDFDQVVDDARKAWLQARHHFDNVTDPDLIDHAIYDIVAAERKYMYLLRLVREERSAVAVEAAEAQPPEEDIAADEEPRVEAVQLESTRPTA